MKDTLGRELKYLRISVTDRCNLRCIYCMPAEGVSLLPRQDLLTFEEISRAVEIAARLGFVKVRLTGGEPLVRQRIARLVSMLSQIKGIEHIAMTTNGILLPQYAQGLQRAGLETVNVSLDTLREETFRRMTRGAGLKDVLAGIDAAKKAQFKAVKVNVVVMRGINDNEIADFVQFASEHDLEVRFIELMTLGEKALADAELFVPEAVILKKAMEAERLVPLRSSPLGGPAKLFRIAGKEGSVGIIAGVSKPFCERCNRLRLTPEGRLRSCLLMGGEVDLRPLLREKARKEEIIGAFERVAMRKPTVHSGCGKAMMWRIGG